MRLSLDICTEDNCHLRAASNLQYQEIFRRVLNCRSQRYPAKKGSVGKTGLFLFLALSVQVIHRTSQIKGLAVLPGGSNPKYLKTTCATEMSRSVNADNGRLVPEGRPHNDRKSSVVMLAEHLKGGPGSEWASKVDELKEVHKSRYVGLSNTPGYRASYCVNSKN